MRRALLLGPCVKSTDEVARLLAEMGLDARALGLGAPSADAESPLVVGVDGGVAVWRALGVVPQLGVGDWDSLPGGERDPALQGLGERIDLRPSKDRSDLAVAVAAALERGARELDCLGVTGGRADHHLASVFDLAEFADRPEVERIETRDPDCRILFVGSGMGELELPSKPGELFSVFALGGPARVTLQRARYELEEAWLQPSSHGLSNEARGGMARLRVLSGRVGVVIPRTLH